MSLSKTRIKIAKNVFDSLLQISNSSLLGWQIKSDDETLIFQQIMSTGSKGDFTLLKDFSFEKNIAIHEIGDFSTINNPITVWSVQTNLNSPGVEPFVNIARSEFFRMEEDNYVDFYFLSHSDYSLATLSSNYIIDYFYISIAKIDFVEPYQYFGSGKTAINNKNIIYNILKIECVYAEGTPLTYNNHSEIPQYLLAPPCPPIWKPGVYLPEYLDSFEE